MKYSEVKTYADLSELARECDCAVCEFSQERVSRKRIKVNKKMDKLAKRLNQTYHLCLEERCPICHPVSITVKESQPFWNPQADWTYRPAFSPRYTQTLAPTCIHGIAWDCPICVGTTTC